MAERSAERSLETMSAEQTQPIVVDHVAKSYVSPGKVTPVIGDLSFTLGRGEIVSIVGPSGCGKTTMLNVICGLIEPDRGTVRWYGERLGAQKRGVKRASFGYMLQKDLLLPWRKAVDNVKLGMEIRRVPAAEADDRARALLDQLGLHGFADNYPSTLSGGMRQRVALARTLANDPDVLLLDEPFAALDFQTKLLIESDTAKLVRDSGKSVLLITHDIEEAVSIADRVLVLSHRPTVVKASYNISLGAARGDMIAARESPDFGDYVRRIWADLAVVRT
ncbi:ABC transporter ATP-binding protein [Lichenihabitans sp. PAMC28606]|uniref:ABC transporter ATP-binding protein n=1 Tax=Lichenihabitans sp. PAMC28606 TaxID=2880932 RepID=UPI001D0B82C9|nr:ABC transporter ATP-binding protein [Lichenihabitans sp. PAMC28606]UDL94056.1 ABC transporter ATP-binding protein [Lichenihabitans sp. PAMC28606]